MPWLDTISSSAISKVQFDPANRASAAVSGPARTTATPGVGTATTSTGAGNAPASGGARVASAPGSRPQSGGAAGGGNDSFSSLVSMMNQGAQSNAELLQLQQQMQEQDRYFTSISNVLKARHETMKSTISNLSG
jgi:hypothetical protein